MDKQRAQAFELFIKSDELTELIKHFHDSTPDSVTGLEIFHCLKEAHKHWKPNLWKALDECLAQEQYTKKPLAGKTLLIVGAGPAGLVSAIEAAFLGATPVVLEKREAFSRHNVLLLWEYTVEYFKRIGAKALYPRLCVGSLFHVSIRRLQLVLTQIALILGAQIHINTEFVELSSSSEGVHAIISHNGKQETFSVGGNSLVVDALIGADGLNSHVASLCKFERKVAHAKQAIGITWNFVNSRTPAEVHAEEITFSRHMLREWFDNLKKEHSIDLENCVYLCDETHYFICTAPKENLLSFGVLKEDFSSSAELLSADNIDKEKLVEYTQKIASFAELPVESLEMISNEQGEKEIQMFDFTQKQAATEQIRFVQQGTTELFVSLVGDALTEPFWPQGTGANRAVLSAQDSLFYYQKFLSSNSKEKTSSLAAKYYSKLCFSTSDGVRANNSGFGMDFSVCLLDPATRYM